MHEQFWPFINKQNYIFWKAVCREDRNAGISHTESAVSQFGFIVDFKMYSDMETVLRIEIAESKIDSLYDKLKTLLDMDDFELLHSDSDRERTVFLNITFPGGSGDLKIEGPIGPG
jgi:hypothetical protein